MEYVYAALLLHKLNQEINEENIKNVVKSAGATPNDVMVKALVAALSEVNIDEALKAAAPVLTPSSATAGTVSGSTTSAGQGSPTASKAEEEEKKEEKKEEEALEGLSALFG